MRDHYLDSTKAILIFLVVLGHFLEKFIGWSDPANHVLLGTIYFIHMPAFIFVSGMLFKDQNYLKNILFFISLYVPFQFLFPLFNAIWSGNFQFNWNIFEKPYWILWYLMGMMVWTFLTHFLIKTKFPIVIALIFALLVGLSPWNNYQYSVGRIFLFLPFFVVGTVYGKQFSHFIKQQKYASLSAVIILVAIANLVYFTRISSFWLYGSYSYQQLKVDWLDGTLTRIGCLLVSSLGIYAIFGIARLLNGRLIQLGTHTLPVYLLHGFIILAIARYLKLDFHIGVEIFICMILSILSCWLLQQHFFNVLLRKLSLWLMKPTQRFFMKK